MSAASFLDPAFVRELEALRRRLSLRVATGHVGDHLARRRGGSTEFAEHRGYAPGDDLRRVDWLAYARTGDAVVKLFRAEEDAILRVALDTSGSLTGAKLVYALRVAAALGYMALTESERVQVIPFADAVYSRTRPLRGRGALPEFLRGVEALRGGGGGTRIALAIDAAVTRARPGTLAVVSDFLDPEGFEEPLQRAHAAGHDVMLVQVLDREEVDPTLDGDLLLEDAETGETVEITADPETIDGYRARMLALFESLREFARARRMTYVRALTDEPIEAVLRRVVDRRVEA